MRRQPSSLGLVIVMFATSWLMLASGVARGDEAAQLPDYWKEASFIVDAPGTSSSLGAGFCNPAAWPMRGRPGLLFAWEEPVDEGPGVCACSPARTGAWAGVLSMQQLAFGARSFLYENAAGDARHWNEYTVGLGGGRDGYAWGIGYAWSRADEGLAARHERLMFGSIQRSRVLSFGLATHWDLEVDEGLVEADLGVRPFGPRLTLFADATFDESWRLDDIGTRRCRTGYGLEIQPVRGITLGAKALNTGEVSVRLGVGLTAGVHAGSAVHLNAEGEHAATTYSFETDLPRPDLGIVRGKLSYPEIDLCGTLAYQRYRWFDQRRTLLSTLREIDACAANPRVGGVVLNLSGVQADGEMLWELRQQLAGLRAQGKSVTIYFDRLSIGGYMLASVADQLWMDPAGDLDVRGLTLGRTYLRGTLDKLGLGVDEWRFFTYKSAFETLSRESMSDADREQWTALIDDLYEHAVGSATAARSVARSEWDRLVREQGLLLPKEAQAAGLIDSIGTYEQAKDAAREAERRTGDDASAAQLATLMGDPVWGPYEWGDRDRIALLYAIGPCEMESGIKGRVLSKQIREAARDRTVKAIVIRADSPGGDALPSDLVSREMKAAAEKKPVIVSQGRVAGSGGYWISMYADSILASPLTLTGSIGVIGGWIWNEGFGGKLGITYDHVQRGEHADLGAGMTLPVIGAQVPERPLTPEERSRTEQVIRSLYDEFVGKVAEGRGMTKDEVDAVGQGRVWSGIAGREKGLVDELGGLWDALLMAKHAAGIDAGHGVRITEGPSLGLFNLPFPQLKLFGIHIGAGDASTAAVGAGSAAALDVLTAGERLYLEQLAKANGKPLPLVEPFEIRDGERIW
jgi:protease-4